MSEKIYRYRLTGYSLKIEKQEILKETEKSVWYLMEGFSGKVFERIERKVTDYHKWFDTFQLAKDHLIAKKISKLESLAAQHVTASNELTKIEALEEK